MRRVWAGELQGQAGPMRRVGGSRPTLLFGGLVSAAYQRAATQGEGWVAPLFGLKILEGGVTAVRRAWADAGRSGQPRVVTGRSFSLGANAEDVADEYVRHYYGDEYFPLARVDTLTSPQQIRLDLDRLANAGTTDVVLYPSSADLAQVEILGEAIGSRLRTNHR